MKDNETSRRNFLKSASAATAGVLATGVTARAGDRKSDARVIGANDRVRIGVIGVGGQGMAHVRSLVDLTKTNTENAEIVAVCDVFDLRTQDAKKYITDNLNNACKEYKDYRALIDDNDVDAVLIATPEHWHGKMAVEAMEAGKHVYLEKPMTRDFDWAKKVYDTAKKTKVCFQLGVQFTSDDKWRKANELISGGKIGHPVWSQTSYCRNSKEGEWNYGIDNRAKPGENLDWDLWLGHKWGLTPKRDWDPERYFRWRKYLDYSGGITHDLFSHRLTPFMISIGPEFPVRVVASGGIFVHHDREVPDTIHLMADFPAGHTIFVAGSTANELGLPDLIRGHKGNMFIGQDSLRIAPERTYAEEVEEMNEKAGGTGENITLHERNWIKCIRTGEKPYCHADLAFQVMTTIALGEMSYQQNKAIRFDPEKMRIIK